MKKENVTISFESEQLASSRIFAQKEEHKHTGAAGGANSKCLYESEVPEPVREYLDSRRGAAPVPGRSGKTGEAAAAGGDSLALAQPTDERNGE